MLVARHGECRQQVAVVTLAWAVMGIILAFSKGQFGRTVSWIGGSFEATDNSVIVTILKSRLDELLSMARDMLTSNVAPLKQVRTVTGKAQSIASLLWTWRPFIYSPQPDLHSKTRPPENSI